MRTMMLVALGLGMAAPTPAHAGKKDNAWAQCLWQRVPTSTAAWLATSPARNLMLVSEPSPAETLEYRLQAACRGVLTPAGKQRPASFNAKAVRRSLEGSRPASLGPDTIEPGAYRCDLHFENDTEMKNRAGTDWGFRQDGKNVSISSVRFMFAGQGNTAVGLKDGAGLRRCGTIQSDGSILADASEVSVR